MPAGRFIADELALGPGAVLDLPPELAHQARDVLRLSLGGTLTLLDGQGGEYPAEIVALERRRVAVRLGERVAAPGASAPPLRVVLCQGMLKAAKYETIVRMGTELGVAAFMPLLTERAVAAVEEASAGKRARWRKIAAEAVEQCGGSRLPALEAPSPLPHALAEMPPGAVALIPWEGERSASLRSALERAIVTAGGIAHIPEVRLFIGPEGGFSAGEIALAERHGAVPVTLGPRILRAETAAIVAAALTLDSIYALASRSA